REPVLGAILTRAEAEHTGQGLHAEQVGQHEHAVVGHGGHGAASARPPRGSGAPRTAGAASIPASIGEPSPGLPLGAARAVRVSSAAAAAGAMPSGAPGTRLAWSAPVVVAGTGRVSTGTGVLCATVRAWYAVGRGAAAVRPAKAAMPGAATAAAPPGTRLAGVDACSASSAAGEAMTGGSRDSHGSATPVE